MAISILDMGNTKKRNVRETIISILSKQYPLTIKKIYSLVKKEYKLDVTYQAVFKLVKEMLKDNILQNGDTEMEYQLNISWIKQLEDELSVIKKSYSVEKSSEGNIGDEVNGFIAEVGPKIKEYLKTEKSAIIAISSGGKLFALNLWKYLSREGLDSKYSEYATFDDSTKKGIGIEKSEVKDRVVILVDSEVYSGRHYKLAMKKFDKFKAILKIKEIKFVANRDLLSVADYSRKK